MARGARPLAGLKTELDHLSTETWDNLEYGDKSRIKFREDSVTEHNLLRLRLKFPQLKVFRFNQNEEKAVGADWEWWIGSPSDGWYCLRIQAKRAHGSTYKYLDHPGVAPGAYQYDTLIDSCRGLGYIYPFHVFYNGCELRRFSSDYVAAMSRSPHWPKAKTRQDPKRWGCAAVPSDAVRDLHSTGGPDRSKILRYLEVAMPWSHLFLPRGRATPGRSLVGDFHFRAYEATLRAQPGYMDNDVAAAVEDFDGRLIRRPELPAYAEAVRLDQTDETQNMSPPAPTVVVLDCGADVQQAIRFVPVARMR